MKFIFREVIIFMSKKKIFIYICQLWVPETKNNVGGEMKSKWVTKSALRKLHSCYT
jgi:hypothetical protein